MSIQLDNKDLIHSQQMEVAVNGPDGATHLILCMGVVDLGSVSDEVYTFLVGPHLSRRQFVGVIASGALSRIQTHNRKSIEDDANIELETNLVSINANYDDEAGQVKVRAEAASSIALTRLAISYNVYILAELPIL